MIKTKQDLERYLEQDRRALFVGQRKHPKLFGDEIWKYQILLRKTEYHLNCGSKVSKVLSYYDRRRLKKAGMRLGFSIPPNVFGPGLSIAHYGTIVVNENSRVGKNCRIQEMVCIGATNGSEKAPVIGDNCFLGTGAKVIGEITIADNVAIGANAVVCKSIEEPGTTWGGVPAKKISENSSRSNLCRNLFSEEPV